MEKLAFLLFELMNDGKIFKGYLVEKADEIKQYWDDPNHDEKFYEYKEVFDNSELGSVAKSIVEDLSE